MSKIVDLLRRWFLHAQRLFHMLVGTAFLLLAMAGGAVCISEWHYYRQASSLGVYRFTIVAVFTVVLILFGLYSFAKARSVR